MKNYIAPGTRINVTLAAAATSGVPIVAGTGLLGIPSVDGAIGDTIAVAIEGVFELPKATAAVIGQGEQVLWDSSADNVDDDQATPASGDFLCGYAMEAAGNGATTVLVRINKPAPTVT